MQLFSSVQYVRLTDDSEKASFDAIRLIRVVDRWRKDGLFRPAYVHERNENLLSPMFDLSNCVRPKNTIDERSCTSIAV